MWGDGMMINESFFFIENNRVYVVDQPSCLEEDAPYMLALVESLRLFEGYEESDQTRAKNTLYVWWKEGQETFKGEVTIKNLVGWEGEFTFVGFGSTVVECIQSMVWQFTTNNRVDYIEG